MKRPLFAVGSVLLISLLVFFRLNSIVLAAAASAVCAVGAAVAMLFLRRKNRHFALVSLILVCICISGVSFLLSETLVRLPALENIGSGKEVEAVVTDYPVSGEKRFHVNARLCKTQTAVRLSLSKEQYYLYFEDISVGDMVSFEGTVYVLGAGTPEIENSFRSRRMFIGAYPTGKISVEPRSSFSPGAWIKNLRHHASERFKNDFEGIYGGMASAALFGDKTELDDEVYRSFQKAGVSHIFAVSGLHISIWILALSQILSFLGLGRKRSGVFLLLFVAFAAALTGFSPSVCRAALFASVYLLGYVFGREGDGLNSLGLACCVMLLANPFLSFNVSFLLSVSATLGILAFSSPVLEKLKKNVHFSTPALSKAAFLFVSVAVISFGAWLFTLPVIIAFFGEVSLVSVISNLLIYPATAPMIICFGLYALLYYVPVLGAAAKLFGKCFAFWCVFICRKLSSFRFSFLQIPEQYRALASIGAVCVIALMLLLLYRPTIKRKSLLN